VQVASINTGSETLAGPCVSAFC